MVKNNLQKILMIVLLLGVVFLTGCTDQSPTDKELYLNSWLLHNIDDSTPTLLEPNEEDYAIYNYVFNFPGKSPLYYAGIMFFTSPFQDSAASSHIPVATPFIQTIYSYINNPVPENYERRFGLYRAFYLNYLRGENRDFQFAYELSGEELIGEDVWNSPYPNNGEVKEFSFGGPYVPGSIMVEDVSGGEDLSYILLRNHLLQGKNTYVKKDTRHTIRRCVLGGECEDHIIELEAPKFEIYKNGELYLEEYMKDWNEYDLHNSQLYGEGNYTVNLIIPAYYPTFNRTYVTAEFSTYSQDKNPPWLDSIKILPRFKQGEDLEIEVSAKDDSARPNMLIQFKDETGVWEDVNIISISGSLGLGDGAITNVGIINAFGNKIDLRIILTDASNNTQTYIIEPVSLVEENLEIEIEHNPEIISPGTLVEFSGKITDEENAGVSNLLLEVYHNGEVIERSYTSSSGYESIYDYEAEKWVDQWTDGGEFEFEVEIPVEYAEEDDFSLVYGGTGVYDISQYIMSGLPQIFEKDVAVLEVQAPNPLKFGYNNVNITVANVGKVNLDDVDISAFTYYGSRETRNISLAKGEIKKESFDVLVQGSGNKMQVTGEVYLEDDMNPNNNRREIEVDFVKDVDAYIYIKWPGRIIINESKELTLIIGNDGIKTLEDVNYTLEYAEIDEKTHYGNLEELDFTLIKSGTIDSITKRKTVEEKVDIEFNKEERYYLRARINVSGDVLPENNVDYRSIKVYPSGADLYGYLHMNSRLTANEPANISIRIWNEGNEDAENGKASLYYKEGYCTTRCHDEYSILIGSEDLTIKGEDYKYTSEFEFTPPKSGFYTFISVLEASNEINSEDNIGYGAYKIKERGPDITVWREYSWTEDSRLITGEESEMVFYVRNFGTDPAENINLSLYETEMIKQDEEYITNYYFINNTIIEFLDKDETVYVNLSFIPNKKGEVRFLINASLENDVDPYNNRDITYGRVLSRGIDVAPSGLYGFLIANEPSQVSSQLMSLGTENAIDTNFSLYFEEELVANKLVEEIGEYERMYLGSEVIPTETGTRIPKAVAELEEDVDQSDNEMQEELELHFLKKVNLTITDSQGNNVTRLLYSRNGEFFNDKINLTLPVLDGETYFAIIDYFAHETDGERFVGIGLDEVIMSDEERIISEYYPIIQQNSTEYYAVFANNFSFDYIGEIGFAIELTGNQINETGMDQEDLGSYASFYCEEFDFITRQCSENWIKVQEERVYYGDYKFTRRFSVEGRLIDKKIEAIALSKSVGFDGNTTFFRYTPDKIADLILEKRRHGVIEFKGETDISRLRDNESLLDYIIIDYKKISIDTNMLPELAGIPAKLTFRNIEFRNPIVLYNGNTCPSSVCTNILFNELDNTLILDISGFSEFEVVEGPYCGDESCDAGEGEDCNSCIADCGNCGQAEMEERRGGGGGGGFLCSTCPEGRLTCFVPDWQCQWGPCVDNVQKFVCNDKNTCGASYLKPDEDERACISDDDCVDIDEDGYGAGVDCLGPDLNDDDPAINTVVLQPVQEEVPMKTVVGVVIVIVVIVILIVLVLLYIKMRNKKKGIPEPPKPIKSNKPVKPVIKPKQKIETGETRMKKAKGLVKQARTRGMRDNDIKEMFKKKGWKEENINKILKK